MKSELFQENPTPTKKLGEDLALVASVPNLDEVSKSWPSIASRYVRAPNSKAEAAALDIWRESSTLTAEQFEALLKVSAFLLGNLGEKDSWEAVSDDLKTLHLAEDSHLAKLKTFISGLVDEHKRSFGLLQKIYSTQHAAIRVPSGVSTVVDLRAVIPQGFHIGDDPAKYSPTVKTLVPIAIMRLVFDDGENVVFQLDSRTLRILAAELDAAEKEMAAIVKYVGNEKTHSGRTGDE